MQSKTEDLFTSLLPEIFLMILNYLPLQDQVNISQSCKKFRGQTLTFWDNKFSEKNLSAVPRNLPLVKEYQQIEKRLKFPEVYVAAAELVANLTKIRQNEAEGKSCLIM